jgi:hypothetical protein
MRPLGDTSEQLPLPHRIFDTLRDMRSATLPYAISLLGRYNIVFEPHPDGADVDGGALLQWLGWQCDHAVDIPDDDSVRVQVGIGCAIISAWARLFNLCFSSNEPEGVTMEKIAHVIALLGQLQTIAEYERHGVIDLENAFLRSQHVSQKQKKAAEDTNAPRRQLRREAMIRCALRTDPGQPAPPRKVAKKVIAALETEHPEQMLVKPGNTRRSGPTAETLLNAIEDADAALWKRVLALVHGAEPETEQDKALLAEINSHRDKRDYGTAIQ